MKTRSRLQPVGRLLLLLIMLLTAVWWGTRVVPAGAMRTQTRSAVSQAALPPVNFARQIRPLLADNCYACHGPDEQQRKARLRLDTKAGAFAKSGVLIAGNATQSRLFQRIAATDVNLLMPPVSSGHKLTAAQIELIKRWINEGAQWNEHWAYVVPQRPAIPAVKNSTWVRNPLDAFVLARLEKEGLQPAAEADRATLLRRVTFDLTGLPPTTAELDAFLNDKAPDAYEKVVDRLLASPRYGERLALQWLDLARYADTHGFHIDSHRDMWVWRDWVIKAFNENKPFDQFTIEQLAGDLLPNATLEQRIATGFNRNHMINFEGGAIPEEYQVEYVIDRVETTANTWLGMTMGCARCHTHKYDPITQKEFYQFFAFFNTVNEQGLDGRKGNAVPLLPLPSDAQKAQQADYAAAIAKLNDALSDQQIAPLQAAWEKPLLGQRAVAATRHLQALYEFDGSLSDASGRFQHGRTAKGDPAFGAGMVSRGVTLDAQTELRFGNVATIERDQPATLAVWLRPSLGKTETIGLQKIADETTRRGHEFRWVNGRLFDIQRWAAQLEFRLTANWPNDAIVVRTKKLFYTSEWRHLTITWEGTGKAAGLRIYLDGQPQELEVVTDSLTGATQADAELMIGTKVAGKGYGGGIDDLRFYSVALAPREIEQLAVHHPIQTILSGISGKRTKEESDRLREYFLTRIATPQLQQQYAELKRLKKEKTQLDESIVSTMVMQEQTSKARESFVLARGDYRNKTEKVMPGVPVVLPALPNTDWREGRPTRLTLAKWLTASDHPLTARVTVNRFWQMIFGIGLVKTAEDFGSQGEPPSNQELLDWLAVTFRDGAPDTAGDGAKWNVKRLLRMMVTSATYRQSSVVTPALRERDPENRLLARGPRFRLPAELLRDNALAVSGLLNPAIGGKSVKPYHPQGLWEEMAFGDGFSEQTYVQGHGDDLYRRTMYTFWKRTVPPPTLVTFDAPDREKCVGRRPVTNTPLQALITLNDPTYVEAARALAQRTLLEGGKQTDARLRYAFRRATARMPSARELAVLRGLLTTQQQRYRTDAQAATQLLAVGESPYDKTLNASELAAWTMVASTILNLDETITKE